MKGGEKNMMIIKCDRCGCEVSKKNESSLELKFKSSPFDSSNLKIESLCTSCRNEIMEKIKEFMRKE